jgi:hypothetical protein
MSSEQATNKKERTNYTIYNLKSGKRIANMSSDGIIDDEGDQEAIATLRKLLQREITVSEPVPGYLSPSEGVPQTPWGALSGGQEGVRGKAAWGADTELGAAGQSDDEYDPFPEENMCYFGLVTIRPGDPDYLSAFIRRLPISAIMRHAPSTIHFR